MQGILDDPVAAADATRRTLATERLVKLYETWDVAVPEACYDVSTAEWRATLQAELAADR